MAESEKKKRKREARESEAISAADIIVGPRITYHTPFKSFERVFNETSLDDTKRVVCAKLGLDPSVNLELSQLRGERKIVLEDEDDFRAFRIALHTNSLVEVQVNIAGSGESNAPATKKRKTRPSVETGPTPSTSLVTPLTGGTAAYPTPNAPFSFQPFPTSSSIAETAPPRSITSIASSSHSKSMSPTITSPMLPFAFPTMNGAVRTLPSAISILGPAGSSLVAGHSGASGEESQEKEKEKPKRVRKKSEVAPSSVLSPAAREKAAAILERHRQSLAERAKPRVRKKKEVAKQPEPAPAPAEPIDEDEDAEKPKKEKRKKKKKKYGADDEAQQDVEQGAEQEDEIAVSPKKQKKKKDKSGHDSAPRNEAEIQVRVEVPDQAAKSKGKETTVNVTVNTAGDKSKQTRKLAPVSNNNTEIIEIPDESGAPHSAQLSSSTKAAIPAAKQPSGRQKAQAKPPICPFCRKAPFHLRTKCPVVKERGPALMKRLEELKKGGLETGGQLMVKEVEAWLETEAKRDRLRVANAKGTSKKPVQPEMDEGEDSNSEILEVIEVNDEDEDEDERAVSVPHSLERPTTSANSLVAVQRPGEGSDTASSDDDDDDEDDDEHDHPGVQDDGNEDTEMHDRSRASTPQMNRGGQANGKTTSHTNSTSSHSSSSSSVQLPAKTTASESRANKQATRPQSFGLMNGEPSDVLDDAAYEQMDTANILVSNSSDSEDEKMTDLGAMSHTPMDDETRGALFQQRGSPVAKGRALGTPSRIRVMKDRHGNTAPVSRSFGGESDEDGEPFGHSKATPFPDHKLKAASQPTTENPRKSFMPRLSNFSMFGFNMLKGGQAANPSSPATPIIVPRPGRTASSPVKEVIEDSSSSSSSDSDSEEARRVPKAQRASSGIARPSKSLLSQL